MHDADQGRLRLNGVNGADGSFLLPPMTPRQISALARGWRPEAMHRRELDRWHEASSKAHWGPKEGIDPKKLEEAGWGVIFAPGVGSDVKKALAGLLAHRREQVSRGNERYYREFTFRSGERDLKGSFLREQGAARGRPADPSKVPYYLLIVGGPDEIPFQFQYQLDIQYAVGRIAFDTPEEYERYACSVIWAEKGEVLLPRKAAFFGVRRDLATRLSHDLLVEPLAESLAEDVDGWQVEKALADEATKARLLRYLGGDATPSLLFTASHGIGFPSGHPSQYRCQGALLCQDWLGPETGKVTPDHYVAAADVARDATPLGLVSLHFACFGGGTPERDSFARRDTRNSSKLAPHDFLARLPQRLLAHPRGGALAVVGHVDRAWSYSFHWPKVDGEQTQVFESVLRRLLKGYPVGAAMDFFGESYAELSSDLATELEDVQLWGKRPDDQLLSHLWTARNDARNFVVFGDPAVRLPAAGPAYP